MPPMAWLVLRSRSRGRHTAAWLSRHGSHVQQACAPATFLVVLHVIEQSEEQSRCNLGHLGSEP